jgi:Na+/phosphate symporter
MIINAAARPSMFGVSLALMFCTGCSRAPSFEILGSFFPAWLVCLALGLVLTAVAHSILSTAGIVLAVPLLTYPSLTALFTFALWLSFFR